MNRRTLQHTCLTITVAAGSAIIAFFITDDWRLQLLLALLITTCVAVIVPLGLLFAAMCAVLWSVAVDHRAHRAGIPSDTPLADEVEEWLARQVNLRRWGNDDKDERRGRP